MNGFQCDVVFIEERKTGDDNKIEIKIFEWIKHYLY